MHTPRSLSHANCTGYSKTSALALTARRDTILFTTCATLDLPSAPRHFQLRSPRTFLAFSLLAFRPSSPLLAGLHSTGSRHGLRGVFPTAPPQMRPSDLGGGPLRRPRTEIRISTRPTNKISVCSASSSPFYRVTLHCQVLDSLKLPTRALQQLLRSIQALGHQKPGRSPLSPL